MLNLLNKIITVIFTLVIIINYCNGDIIDASALSDGNKFTREGLQDCPEFNSLSEHLLINNFQYFVDKDNNYYAIHYYEYISHANRFSTEAHQLYNVKTNEKLGEFKGCIKDSIHFNKEFKLKDISFLKPVDSFVQPPELKSAHKLGMIKNCEEFDKHVLQVNTSGFLIYKDELSGTFHRICREETHCAINDYSYSRQPRSTSFLDRFRSPEPFGFFWKEWFNYEERSKLIYKDCKDGKLKFILYRNGRPTVNPEHHEHPDHEYFTLSHLTFYNIKPKIKSLDHVKSNLNLYISTCTEFNRYLENPINISNGYIYFSDLRDDTNPLNYAIKINPYGPENLRERSHLLIYRSIDSIKAYLPLFSSPRLFLGCIRKDKDKSSLIINDSLVFELDSNPNDYYPIPLHILTFYNPVSKNESDMEMKEFIPGVDN